MCRKGHRAIKLPTITAMMGLRILYPNEVEDLCSKLKLHPYEKRDNPPESKFIFAGKESSFMAEPKGIAHWERLNTVIERKPVEERNRFFVAMIRSLGMEKGKPFEPDERPRKILESAALVGKRWRWPLPLSASSVATSRATGTMPTGSMCSNRRFPTSGASIDASEERAA